MKFTVSIVCYTALDHAKKCIASVIRNSLHSLPVKIILTANGNPAAAEYFKSLSETFANITVVSNPENMGFGRPHNHALGLCDTEFMVCLNDDCIVGPGWLEALLDPFQKYPDAALSCPDSGCSALLPSFHGTHGTKEYCEGSCLMVRVSFAKQYGLFDETLPGLAYGEDSDVSLRMRKLGKSLHWVKCNVTHAVAQTSRKVPQVKAWQEANHAVLRKRWAHYLRHRRMDYPILINRTAAYGDCLLLTPIIRRLKETHPLSQIHIQTACSSVFDGNPDVFKAAGMIHRLRDAMAFNLDGAYENRKQIHIVDAYYDVCQLPRGSRVTFLHVREPDRQWAARECGDGKFIAVFPGPVSWRSKEWPQERWKHIRQAIEAAGFKVRIVGDSTKTTLGQLSALIQRASGFVGLDSLPLHIAEALGTPAVGLFGITDPQFICTNPKTITVCSSAPSFGHRHRIVGKKEVDDGGNAMRAISVDQVLEAVKKLLT